jgi:hypothetical protein
MYRGARAIGASMRRIFDLVDRQCSLYVAHHTMYVASRRSIRFALQAKTAEFSLTHPISMGGSAALSEMESLGDSECTTPRSSCRHVTGALA